jgi:hypothetical protein
VHAVGKIKNQRNRDDNNDKYHGSGHYLTSNEVRCFGAESISKHSCIG